MLLPFGIIECYVVLLVWRGLVVHSTSSLPVQNNANWKHVLNLKFSFDLPWPCFKFSGSQWKTRTEPIWRAFLLQKNHNGWWHIMSFFNLQYNWNSICNCVSGRYWAKPFPGFWWTLFTNQCQRNIHTQLGRYRYLFFIIHQYVWVPVDYLTIYYVSSN